MTSNLLPFDLVRKKIETVFN